MSPFEAAIAAAMAEHDRLDFDRHLPLVNAWEKHRRDVAVVRKGRPRTGAWSMA